ncbi:hypothetical protein D7W79_03400 [Corallococcus exercitus]|uniref:Uncharacterized protein n=1 Tax=Corallococcus exercitus TaxID=2316736 RepID=A0A3A8IF77_9BACT|nr:hypothetical protein [Corallococcus exercitus]NOK33287.1 hypothetical protein [Corallococcus exercitus]RKG82097.1 hypothetical protein D7W79_03400 [Corallococcus exercitus]
MADNDKRPAAPQPAEDFYGRPIHPRQGGETLHEQPERSGSAEEEDERKRRRERTEADEKGVHLRTEEDEDDVDDRDLSLHDASGLHPYDPRERAPGSSLDDMPDGDGPRSDAGTNPVSDVYRYGHPDRVLPDLER